MCVSIRFFISCLVLLSLAPTTPSIGSYNEDDIDLMINDLNTPLVRERDADELDSILSIIESEFKKVKKSVPEQDLSPVEVQRPKIFTPAILDQRKTITANPNGLTYERLPNSVRELILFYAIYAETIDQSQAATIDHESFLMDQGSFAIVNKKSEMSLKSKSLPLYLKYSLVSKGMRQDLLSLDANANYALRFINLMDLEAVSPDLTDEEFERLDCATVAQYFNLLPEDINSADISQATLNRDAYRAFQSSFGSAMRAWISGALFNIFDRDYFQALSDLRKLSDINRDRWFHSNFFRINDYRNELSIKAAPKAVLENTSLTHIEIHNQRLVALPYVPLQLPKLSYLSLESNYLRACPVGLENLINLTHINLSNNRLNVFPEKLLRLKKLRQIYLSYNEIESLPEKWTKRLDTLHLRNNKLVRLPDGMRNLRKDIDLNLQGNQFEDIKGEKEKFKDFETIVHF